MRTNQKLSISGKEFWQQVSGPDTLYLEIINPPGCKAREKNEIFQTNHAAAINKFVREFTVEYRAAAGQILREKIIKLNSTRKCAAP